MDRRAFSSQVVAVLFLVLPWIVPLGFWCYLNPVPGWVTEWRFYRIRKGMTLPQVQRILGPGEARSAVLRPTRRGGMKPVVRGDQCYLWEPHDYRDIWVGFRDGKVCDKWQDPGP
jgi:hypothetical protein